VNSEGPQEILRPKIQGLARVSIVRGQGPDEGLAFIDDYIVIKEKISNYNTQFSGLTPEDLDPNVSRHSLIPRKLAYKRLWTLLNLGCKFIGHGLGTDFRVINIQVPRKQVRDTVDLFREDANSRKLGLAWLAKDLLEEEIQVGTHDSIEDARTALKLYRKYQHANRAGTLRYMIEDTISRHRTNFKALRREDISRSDTPSAPTEPPSTPSRRGEGSGSGQFVGSGLSVNWTPG
jgi:PAB-dependent poly(A)-specific ribonuclease subunit 2